jgi:hypothetical protein
MFRGVIHHHNDTANARDKIHRSPHALDQFAGDHPVCQIAILGHLHRPKDRHGNFAAADHRK